MIPPVEVLGPQLSKSEAQTIERDAKKHLDSVTSNAFALAVDLRRLQDGNVHLLRGYPNFGDYIAAKFEGHLTKTNAKTLSTVGRVVLALMEERKLTLAGGSHNATQKVLGTTGARALAAVQGRHGTKPMLAVYDAAAKIARDRGTVITDEIVKAVLHPPQVERAPEPMPAIEEPEGEVDDGPELSREEHRLLELLGNLQDVCLQLENFIEHGQARSERVAAYIRDVTSEAGQLTLAFEEATR
jgi:hypothetical protein